MVDIPLVMRWVVGSILPGGHFELFFSFLRFSAGAIKVVVCAILEGRKEGHFLFNDALNTFYLQLYGVGQMVKDHSDSERGNTLPPHGLLFPISSKGSFICTIPQ